MGKDRPLILVSNDDGIQARGIKALAEALAPLGDVWVVAPDREQSAMSHALTLIRPLRIRNVMERWYAVDGTPTDAVNVAVNGVLDRTPDLVVSGINRGANLGSDVHYSGTVAAAMEGTLLGLPAFAVSLIPNGEKFDYGPAAGFAARTARFILENGLPRETFFNINVPGLPEDRIKGWRITRQGRRIYGEAIVEKTDPRGLKYYWIGGDELKSLPVPGGDIEAIEAGYISVSPLHLDMTNYGALEKLKAAEF